MEEIADFIEMCIELFYQIEIYSTQNILKKIINNKYLIYKNFSVILIVSLIRLLC